jgi:hypothetical protein
MVAAVLANDRAPVRRFWPLKVVALAMRSISARRDVISVATDWESDELSVLLAASTESSRIRWSMECTSLSAPSAVWTIETPSCAFR